MGDAGPPTPLPEVQTTSPVEDQQIREIHVLVTGFGPFKSFTINPSWQIASSLPLELSPLASSDPKDPTAQPARVVPPHPHYPFSSLLKTASVPQDTQDSSAPQPLRPPNTTPYKIRVHTYPDPVRVAYAPTAALIPPLLDPATNPEHIEYDYILHIGLASGRDSYTLETIGHRAEYLIPDVDDGIGDRISAIWTRQSVPEVLHVGWNPNDVLARWEAEVSRRQDNEDTQTKPTDEAAALTQQEEQRGSGSGVREWMASHGMLLRPSSLTAQSPRQPKKAVVKLSRDAGHFLCEFILMCSLVQLYLLASLQKWSTSSDSSAREKLGKVTFLHVPNGTEKSDVARGVMVAESAIRSVVASWEAGYRNPIVYRAVDVVKEEQRSEQVGGVDVSSGAFEDRATGDEISA